MLTRIKDGEIVDPVNGRLGKGDLWIRDEEIVEAPRGGRADRTFDASGCIVMAGAIDIHSHIGGGNVNTARLLLAGTARCAPGTAGGDAALQRRLVDLRDRLPLREDGFHHRGRAGHVAECCAPHPSRARRHPDHRQGHARHSRQRRLPSVDDPRRRLPADDRGLCRLDGGLDAGAGRQGHQCGRCGRLQGECANLFARRCRAVLRRQLAQDRQDAAGGGGQARHPASAACPLQQSRRPGLGGHGRSDDRGGGGRADAPRASPVLWLRHRRKAQVLLRRGAVG